jgi:hypothetical protein
MICCTVKPPSGADFVIVNVLWIVNLADCSVLSPRTPTTDRLVIFNSCSNRVPTGKRGAIAGLGFAGIAGSSTPGVGGFAAFSGRAARGPSAGFSGAATGAMNGRGTTAGTWTAGIAAISSSTGFGRNAGPTFAMIP